MVERGGSYAFVDGWLAEARSILGQFDVPDAAAMLDWLEVRRDRVPCVQPAPVHLDYHPNNILLGRDGSAHVIDWTQIQVSDPRFDLAWTLMLVGAAEGWEWRDRILAEYERLAVRQAVNDHGAGCGRDDVVAPVSLARASAK